MTIEAITANRLRDGAVVWLDQQGGWTDRVADMAVFEGEAAAQALEKAGAAERQNIVVGLYRIDVRLDGETHVPAGYRELIRALGPSVRADLGKQAEQGDSVRPAIAAAGEH